MASPEEEKRRNMHKKIVYFILNVAGHIGMLGPLTQIHH
jgi:hypothetical protein